jgi:hypothetical protein
MIAADFADRSRRCSYVGFRAEPARCNATPKRLIQSIHCTIQPVFVRTFTEMHVDGSTTASMFIAPEIASLLPDQLRDLRGANIYVIANGQYGAATITTRLRTTSIAKRGIQASLHRSTRGAVLATLALAMRNDMHFNVTAILDDYPFGRRSGLADATRRFAAVVL